MTLPRRTLLLSTLFPLSASGAAAGAAEPTAGQTLLCPLAEAPPVLVPGVARGVGTRLVGSNLYRGLTRLDGHGNPVPDLAHWTVSRDGLRVEFRLQAGVLWHDGSPLTAADVVFSLDRLHRACNPGLDLTRVASIAAAGPLSVVITLREAFQPLLRQVNGLNAAIVPQHVHDVAQWGLDPAVTTPVGCGPFRYDRWLRLARVAGDGSVSAVEFPVLPSLAERVSAVQRDKPSVLVAALMDAPNLARLRADKSLVVEAVVPPGLEYWALLRLNRKRPPLDQAAVRLALPSAIDCSALLWAAWDGFGSTPPDQPAYDPRAAAAQLQAAGLRPGEDGRRAELRLLVPPEPPAALLASALNGMLGLIAIDVTAHPVDAAEWERRVDAADYDMALDLRPRSTPLDGAVLLVGPALAVARDQRMHLPAGVYGGFAGISFS